MQRFELLGRNGAGANSTVFKCRDPVYGRIVAVKKFEGATLSEIIQEAGIMRACAHKHCTTLLEAHQGVDSGICYVVMEHVEHSLSRELLLNPRGLLLPKAKIVAFQLCTALEHVHSKKVIHGDLKPANVLLTAQYNVKLCDFGSASSEVLCSRLADSSADGGWAVSAFPSNHSTAHDPARKPTAAASRWYCAPESLLGGDRSEASDIWAFGCILGELVTGKPLMPGSENELDQLCCLVAMIGGLSEVQEQQLLLLLPWEQRRKLDQARASGPLLVRIPKIAACPALAEVLRACLQPDPSCRPTAEQLQAMPFFHDVRKALQASQSHEDAASEDCGSAGPEPPRARRRSSGNMHVDSPPPGVDGSPDVSSPCAGAAATAAATSEPGTVVWLPAALPGPAVPMAEPPRRVSGVQAAAPVRPVPRTRLSALTATIRGSPFEGDGSYIDLMPQVLRLAAKWEDVREREVLGPIAMAARSAGSSPISPTASLPSPASGEMPTLIARQDCGALAAVLATAAAVATVAVGPFLDVEAGGATRCETPIAASAGGCGAVRTLETGKVFSSGSTAAGDSSAMDYTPASALAAVVVESATETLNLNIPLPASVGAVPYMAMAAGMLAASSAGRVGADAATSATTSASATTDGKMLACQLRNRAILNRVRRQQSRGTRAGSVPLSLISVDSSHVRVGSSATIMQRELVAAAAAAARLPVTAVVGAVTAAVAHRLAGQYPRRSFADLSELESVAECEALQCSSSPDVKRRRGLLLSHNSFPAHLSEDSFNSPGTDLAFGSLQECEPTMYLGARAAPVSGGGGRRMRRSTSGVSLTGLSQIRPGVWQHLFPAGVNEASLPQPILGCSRCGPAASLVQGLASSAASDLHNSAASDTFLQGGGMSGSRG